MDGQLSLAEYFFHPLVKPLPREVALLLVPMTKPAEISMANG